MLHYAVSTYVENTLKTLRRESVVKKSPSMIYLREVLQGVEKICKTGPHYNLGHFSAFMRESIPGMGESLPGMGESLPGMGESIPGMRESIPGMGESLPGELSKTDRFGTQKPGPDRGSKLLGEGLSLNYCVQIGSTLYPSTITAHKIHNDMYLLTSWTKNVKAKKPPRIPVPGQPETEKNGPPDEKMRIAMQGLEFFPYQVLVAADEPYTEKNEEEMKKCLSRMPLEDVKLTTYHNRAMLLESQVSIRTDSSDNVKRQGNGKRVLEYIVKTLDRLLYLAGHPLTADVKVYPNSEVGKDIVCYECMECSKISAPKTYHVLRMTDRIIGHHGPGPGPGPEPGREGQAS